MFDFDFDLKRWPFGWNQSHHESFYRIKLVIVIKEQETNVNIMAQYGKVVIRIENVVVLM